MYRALYEYRTDLKNYLSFETGDQFTVIDQNQKDWYLAQNGYGEIGYIPKNYMMREEVGQSEVLTSIDRAIEVIHFQAGSTGGQYTHAQRENLSKLIQHRKSVVDSYTSQSGPSVPLSNKDESVEMRNKSVRRVAPTPPSRISSVENKTNETTASNAGNRNSAINTNSVTDNVPDEQYKSKRESPEKINSASSPINFPSIENVSVGTQSGKTDLIDLGEIDIPESLGNELIELVRKNTGLSYQSSTVAVETVLGQIGIKVPKVSTLLDRICTTLDVSQVDKVEDETSSDYERLNELFSELAECKDDSQQRGWALHEDEATITRNLEELLSILENAKESISKKAMSADNYECVQNLVQYYQMETRVPLRLIMLKIFNAMCVLDVSVVSMLLFSILTTELAEELQRNIGDIQRSSYVCLGLTMLFSTGDAVPANIHDHLNLDFLRFIFNTLENPPTVDHEEDVSDLLVHFVLAFNLHFCDIKDNLVMKVIAEKNTVKVFSEKILLLFNRGDDPVVMFDQKHHQCNSVMKLLQDLYSNPKTSTVIYTNDEKVLFDIILGHLVDLSPGDQNRTSQLKLMHMFLMNSAYREHKHRVSELSESLHRILEEEEYSGDDKNYVGLIFENCRDILQ